MSLTDDLLDQLRLQRGDFDITAAPALSTSAPGLHPDEGPGAGQERDRALDAEASGPAAPPPATGPTASQERAAADLDASIARARVAREDAVSGWTRPCAHCGAPLDVRNPPTACPRCGQPTDPAAPIGLPPWSFA